MPVPRSANVALRTHVRGEGLRRSADRLHAEGGELPAHFLGGEVAIDGGVQLEDQSNLPGKGKDDTGTPDAALGFSWGPWQAPRPGPRGLEEIRMNRLFAVLAACAALAAAAFDLQGHRGARGLLPENTLPAFEKALRLGVDTLECDMAITRDGVVVIHHDLWLNPDTTRGPDGKWLEARGPAISELTFEELQKYDVGRLKPGTDYARNFPDQVPVDGTRIPRLSDLFDLVKKSGNTRIGFDCETKVNPNERAATLAPEEFARRAIAEIRKAGMAQRTMVQSFDWSTLQVIQKEAPEIRTMYLTSEGSVRPRGPAGSPWLAGFDPARHGDSIPRSVKAAGGRIWAPNHATLTPALLAEAHALGLVVIPWTINDAPTINKILDMGVDGIISDRPDLVLQERARKR